MVPHTGCIFVLKMTTEDKVLVAVHKFSSKKVFFPSTEEGENTGNLLFEFPQFIFDMSHAGIRKLRTEKKLLLTLRANHSKWHDIPDEIGALPVFLCVSREMTAIREREKKDCVFAHMKRGEIVQQVRRRNSPHLPSCS